MENEEKELTKKLDWTERRIAYLDDRRYYWNKVAEKRLREIKGLKAQLQAAIEQNYCTLCGGILNEDPADYAKEREGEE